MLHFANKDLEGVLVVSAMVGFRVKAKGG